ncbi:PKD domain-containing protein, partial [bacterium]|nr:PKD domain-containing protein [bacterium]
LLASASPSLGGQTIWPHPDSTLTGGWLQTVWHQEHPFNARCPWDANRQARCLAGCLAVAMAQLINYHHDASRLRLFSETDNYTSILNGFKFRIDQDCGSYNTLKWPQLNLALSLLQFPLTAESDSGLVDELVYSAGVSIATNYGVDNSQALEGKVPTALRSVFGFSAAEHLFGSDSTILINLQWRLKQALPVMAIVSRSDETSHALIIDGLDERGDGPEDDLYHINYGGLAPGETFWTSLWPPSHFNHPINHGYSRIKSILISSAAPLPPPPPPPPPAPPRAHFTAVPVKGWTGLCVNFKNQCSGTVNQWDWDFGDGSVHEEVPNPTHCYRAAGQYTVTLIAAGPLGADTLTIEKMITVDNIPFIDTGVKISTDTDGTAAWGDVDNDGDPDLIILYYGHVHFYRNDQGQLTAGQLIPSDLSALSLQWIDQDRDNDLDLVVFSKSGNGEYRTQLYRNQEGLFSLADFSLPLVYYGVPAWADFDHDGDADMVAATEQNQRGLTLWQNMADGFIQTDALPDNDAQQGWWCDVDHDQDLDLLDDRGTFYRNEQGRLISEPAPWSALNSLDVADYDRDGDVDFLISAAATSIYRNGGDLRNAAVEQVSDIRQGQAVWLDYDNDSLCDVLLGGRTSDYSHYSTQLYQGENTGFFRIENTTLDQTPSRGAAPADYDLDRDLDFLTLGDNPWGGTAGKLFMNKSASAAALPDPPSNLVVAVKGHTAHFSWSAPSQAGLTFNLSVGTLPGACDILSPMSLRDSGKRLIPTAGNVWNNTQWHLRLPAGEYYWTVQSLDINHNGSPFAEEIRFVIPSSHEPALAPDSLHAEKSADRIKLTWTHSRPEEVYRYHLYAIVNRIEKKIAELDGNRRNYSDSDIQQGQIQQYYLIAESWSHLYSTPSETLTVDYRLPFTYLTTLLPCPQNFFQIADMDNDGDLDILMQYQKKAFTIQSIFRNSLGTYTEERLDFITSWAYGRTCLCDFDNDNDLDLMTLFLTTNASVSFLRNDLAHFSQSFAEIPLSTGFVNDYKISLLDADNDGRQDILISGVTANMMCSSQIVYHTASGWQVAFPDALSNGYGDYFYCDYDQDGDQDLLFRGLMGSVDGASPRTVIRLFNNQNGRFSAVDSSLLGWSDEPTAGMPFWRDCDFDDDNDICVTRDGRTTIYYNDQGRFVESAVNAAVVPFNSSGDLNNDGSSDLIQFENDHYDIYLQGDSGMEKIFTFSTALGMNPYCCDFDLDGDLDILLTYHPGAFIALLRNETENRKNPPPPPVALTAETGRDRVVLRWQPPSNSVLRCREFTYNLRVGSTPGGCEVVSPSADSRSGQRFLITQANMLSGKICKLHGLAAGTYYWSVQTVDPAFVGGPFAAEQSFTVGPTSVHRQEKPDRFALLQNHPNPFNDQTAMAFELASPVHVTLMIYNLSGQLKAVLADQPMAAGRYVVNWHGRTMENQPAASGVYLVRFQAGSFTCTRKLVVIH